MFARAISLVAGLSGAAGLSQFPEFSQQYVQRLGGAVDELSRFVAEFDADAARHDMTRDEALVDLAQGGRIASARAETMTRTVERHEQLSADLDALRDAGPFSRAYQAMRLTDSEVAQAAWQDFKPAMPITFEGIVFAIAGFLGGLGILAALGALWRMIFRRKPAPDAKKA